MYLTEGKGRNRKVVNAEAQTVRILKKSRNTNAELITRTNTKSFASNWEMFDTYDANKNIVRESSSEERFVSLIQSGLNYFSSILLEFR